MKPGRLTSEFWLSLLGLIVPSIASAFTGSTDPRFVGAGIAVSGIYTIARTAVKVACEARAAVEAKAAVPATTAPFDPAVFGGMTASERSAAGIPTGPAQSPS